MKAVFPRNATKNGRVREHATVPYGRYWIRTRIQNSQTRQRVTSIPPQQPSQTVRKPVLFAQATRDWTKSSMRGRSYLTTSVTSSSICCSLSRRDDFSDTLRNCPAPCDCLVLYLKKTSFGST